MTKAQDNVLISKMALSIEWDPSEEGLEPHVEINSKKFYDDLTKHFNGTSFAIKLVEASGESLKETISKISMGDLTCLAAGEVTQEQIIESVSKGVQDTGLYPYSFEKAQDFVEASRRAATLIHERRASGAAEFDMSSYTFDLPGLGELTAINRLLSTASKLPPLEDLVGLAKESGEQIKGLQTKVKMSQDKEKELTVDMERLREEMANMAAQAGTKVEMKVEHDGTIPSGTLEWRKASEIFDCKLSVDFEVPFWVWDGEHPNVPVVDNNYIFREAELSAALYALVSNQRMYLHGHTGTGKTTLIEQMAARMKYPFIRINFDSEVTRMDLIGRDTMTTDDNGNSVSSFVDGMLPRAMSSPCLLVLDEIDFVRPDVAYVMQAATEGNGLRITEDGDRFVQPDPMFRMFATGNTVGQGDEEGLYQGARPQSAALLDRFTVWKRVDYRTK